MNIAVGEKSYHVYKPVYKLDRVLLSFRSNYIPPADLPVMEWAIFLFQAMGCMSFLMALTGAGKSFRKDINILP